MSAEAIMQGGASVCPEEGQVRRIADTIATIPKLATLEALARTPEEFVRAADLQYRMDSAQGSQPGWKFNNRDSRHQPFSYCKGLFSRLGLVTLGNAKGVSGEVLGARITGLAMEMWPAIAGAYMPWELDEHPLSLNDVIGGAQRTAAKGRSLRADLLHALSGLPDGATYKQLADRIGYDSTIIGPAIKEAARIGLVAYEPGRHRDPGEYGGSGQMVAKLAEEHRETIADFIRRRERLIHDPEYRARVAEDGRAYFSSKKSTADILGHAKGNKGPSPLTPQEWELLMWELVPPQDIEMDVLHGLVRERTGSNITAIAFRRRISEMEGLLELIDVPFRDGFKVPRKVRLGQRAYGTNWEEDARCRTRNLDPDIFAPDDGGKKEEKVRRAAEAIFHCMRCPVRAPCLRSAVETGERHLIRGGLKPAQLRNLSEIQKSRILETITIGPA